MKPSLRLLALLAFSATTAFGYADLTIDSIAIPTQIKQGDRLTAYVRIKNIGTSEIVIPEGTDFLSVGFTAKYNTPNSGNTLGHVRKAPSGGVRFPAGGAGSFDLVVVDPYTDLPAAGDYSLLFEVNRSQAAVESDYFNNTKQTELHVTANPSATLLTQGDLAIDSIKLDPAKGTPTTKFKFTVVIRNAGSTKATVEKLGLNVQHTDSYPNGAFPRVIDPGKTFTYVGTFAETRPPGISVLAVEINPGAPDLNPANNSKSVPVTVANASGQVPMPILQLSAPVVTDPKGIIRFGQDVSVSATVKNSGDQQARFHLGDTVLKVSEASKVLATGNATADLDIAVGATTTLRPVTISGLKPGAHTLGLMLDPNNVIQESNETQHVASLKITVNGPDVAVTAALQQGQVPTTKDPLKITATVKNKGPTKAVFPKGSHFLYYNVKGRAPNKMILADAVELVSGQEHNTTLTIAPFATAAGSYDIEVWVDPVNIQCDAAQADNRVTFKVTLTPPPISSKPPTTTTTPAATQPKTNQPAKPPPTKLPAPGR